MYDYICLSMPWYSNAETVMYMPHTDISSVCIHISVILFAALNDCMEVYVPVLSGSCFASICTMFPVLICKSIIKIQYMTVWN